jgi:hypothetical protein
MPKTIAHPIEFAAPRRRAADKGGFFAQLESWLHFVDHIDCLIRRAVIRLTEPEQPPARDVRRLDPHNR